MANGAAEEFFGAGFDPTDINFSFMELSQCTYGTTRTLSQNGEAEVAGISAYSSFGYSYDNAYAGAFTEAVDAVSTIGHWFYRGPAYVIPAPATVWLVALLLVGLPLSRRLH